MKNHSRALARVIAIACLFLGIGFSSTLNYSQDIRGRQKEVLVTRHARGAFDVKLTPQSDEKVGNSAVGRMTIDKQFRGDLEGSSKGQMLMVGTDREGSAGYVAIELVKAKIYGRTGTFALQHSGTMNRGVPQLTVSVVPDSGTGELTGLSGTMTIEINEGKHLYDFEYSIP